MELWLASGPSQEQNLQFRKGSAGVRPAGKWALYTETLSLRSVHAVFLLHPKGRDHQPDES